MAGIDDATDSKSANLRSARRAVIISSASFPIVIIVGYWLGKAFNSGLPFLLPALILFVVIFVLSVRYMYLYSRYSTKSPYSSLFRKKPPAPLQ
jgi:hypothetical protein